MKKTWKKLISLLMVPVIIMGSLLFVAKPVHAMETVQYIERSWDADSKQVVSTTKTAECIPITKDTVNLGGETPSWYVVDGEVVNDNRLVVWGVVNIILTDGSSLTLKDGISVQSDRTLNIYAQSEGDSAGALICGADANDNAAIGSNENTGACGTINIHGGKVTADTKTDGEDAAGIGGGEGGDGGTVVIYGGTVKAYGGSVNDEGGAGIGGGDRDGDVGGNGGTTVIYGGDVTAVGGANAAGIGGGDDGGDSGNIYIYGGTVNATGGSKNSRGGAGIGGGGIGGGKWIEIRGGNVTAQGGANAAGIGGGDEGSGGEITITGGTVNAKGGSEYSDGGAGIGGGNEKDGGTIKITGGEVTSQGGCDAAGIGGGDYGEGGTITITGGTISATGGKYGAGIGGGQSKGGGTITITGGTVTAISGVDGAGIGGGENGAGGTITINSSSEERITAKSVENGAGIGGGDAGAGGNITIENGQIIATGGNRNAQAAEIVKIYGGAGIGGGCRAAGGEITINDGNIEAQGGYGAAGIGGGSEDSAGTVSISGGTIVAKGGVQENGPFSDSGGAGIGTGYIGQYDEGTGTISISGGNVTATGAGRGAGIGGGSNSNCSNITISGGTVNATGDIFAAGIGGGNQGKSGTIHITGGDVTATGGESGAGIGSGCACDNKTDAVNVTIDGGTVHASPGGKYEWHTGENDERQNWETKAGAAIGAGGNRYMNGNNHREEKTYSYFSGAVRLNGGEVYLVAKDFCVIGSTEFAGLVADTGRVEFNGAKVVKQGESFNATMVNARKDQVILKENDTLHQMVLEDNPGELDLNDPARIVLKDDRISYLISSANHYIAVIPCDHRNSTYEDNGADHSRTCKYCTYENTSEEHTYGDPAYTWSDDNSKATATRICTTCKHEDSETVNTESEVIKEATCTTKGQSTYTATFTNETFVQQTKTVDDVAIDPDAHDYKFKDFTWTGDETNGYTAAVANYVCENNPEHTTTAPATMIDEVTDPTCEGAGKTTYTATVAASDSPDGEEHEDSKDGKPTEATDHDWTFTAFTWTGDETNGYTAAVANYMCGNDETHTTTAPAAIGEPVVTDPTCEGAGKTTYTATVAAADSPDGTEHTESKDAKPTESINHNWGDSTYEWSKDNKTVTAKRVCKQNESHVDTETATAEVETTAPTCEKAGKTVYTATFTKAPFEPQTKTVDVKATGHKWGAPTYTWSKDNSTVTATRICSNDKSHKETETVKTTSKTTEPTTTKEGKTVYTATFKNSAFKTQTKEVAIPKKEPEQIWYRLSGNTGLDTMKAIVSEGFTKTGGTVVVATKDGFKDALAAAGFAGLYKAPIVLTDGTKLSAQAQQELQRLKPSKVFVVGGTAAIKYAVTNRIQKVTGVTPTRYFGANSAATSAELANRGKGKWKENTAIIATNKSFKDALSVAPIAYAKGYPILLADNGTTLTKPVLDAMKNIGTRQVIIVGGEAAVTKNVVTQLNKAGIKVKVRLQGANGVKTSAAIANWGLKNGMTANKMGVATSQDYKDALSGAALCGVNKSVLVLADDKAMDNASFPKAHKAQIKKGYVFGGEAAVGSKTWTTLNNATK